MDYPTKVPYFKYLPFLPLQPLSFIIRHKMWILNCIYFYRRMEKIKENSRTFLWFFTYKNLKKHKNKVIYVYTIISKKKVVWIKVYGAADVNSHQFFLLFFFVRLSQYNIFYVDIYNYFMFLILLFFSHYCLSLLLFLFLKLENFHFIYQESFLIKCTLVMWRTATSRTKLRYGLVFLVKIFEWKAFFKLNDC